MGQVRVDGRSRSSSSPKGSPLLSGVVAVSSSFTAGDPLYAVGMFGRATSWPCLPCSRRQHCRSSRRFAQGARAKGQGDDDKPKDLQFLVVARTHLSNLLDISGVSVTRGSPARLEEGSGSRIDGPQAREHFERSRQQAALRILARVEISRAGVPREPSASRRHRTTATWPARHTQGLWLHRGARSLQQSSLSCLHCTTSQ